MSTDIKINAACRFAWKLPVDLRTFTQQIAATTNSTWRSVDNFNTRISNCRAGNIGSLDSGPTNYRFDATKNSKVNVESTIEPQILAVTSFDQQQEHPYSVTNKSTAPTAAAAEREVTSSSAQRRLIATRSGVSANDASDSDNPAAFPSEQYTNAVKWCEPYEQYSTMDDKLTTSDRLGHEAATTTSSLFVKLHIQPISDTPSGTLTLSSRPRTPSSVATGTLIDPPPPSPLVSNSTSSIRVISTVKLNKNNAATANWAVLT